MTALSFQDEGCSLLPENAEMFGPVGPDKVDQTNNDWSMLTNHSAEFRIEPFLGCDLRSGLVVVLTIF